jgi:hypothetical protein
MKPIKPVLAGAILLLVQLLLVLTIAGKYLYERKTRPRIWVLSFPYPPNLPLRGRYLALQLRVDACALPHDKAHFTEGFKPVAPMQRPGVVQVPVLPPNPGYWNWNVSLATENGHLVPKLEDNPSSPGDLQVMTQHENQPCNQLPLSTQVDYFIPDTAKGPFPLKPGQQLWVEVTMPPSGPPRPIQLALSSEAGFQPLHLD